MEGRAARRRLPGLVVAERTALEAADAVVAVSEGSRVDILDCYPAIDPDRVHVIYNGIDTEEYRPDPATDVLEAHGVDPGRRTVLFVGRITRQKGVDLLLDAAPSLDPDAQLVLCAGAADTPSSRRPSPHACRSWPSAAAASCGCARCSPGRGRPAHRRTRRSSCARRSTSRWAS